MASAAGVGLDAHAHGLTAEVPCGRVVVGDAAGEQAWPYQRLSNGALRPPTETEWLHAIATRALEQAGLAPETLSDCALLMGSSGSKLPEMERRWLAHRQDPDFLPIDDPRGHADLAGQLAGRLGLGGPRHYFGTACSSSANALLYGMRGVAHGRYPAALVMGFDFFNQLTFRGFESLMLLDPERARPFDRYRNGLVLGEGVAALVLLPEDIHGARRWRLCGGASLGDTQSPTQTSAREVAGVVHQALADSGVEARDLAGVKAHGTATPSNDAAEGQGLAELLQGGSVPISSLKGALGHTLGACGVVEAAALMACLDSGYWPGSQGHEVWDEDCMVRPARERVPMSSGRFLLNFFGFGGNNCALVLEGQDVD